MSLNSNFTSILYQLTTNHGATVALAKAILSKEQFELFLIESEIQSNISFIDILEKFPDLSDPKEDIIQKIKNKIDSLKKQRDELK